MSKKYKDRYVLNQLTGNVKHWNPNMIGVENMVECTADGVPLELSKKMDNYKDKLRKEIESEMRGESTSDDFIPVDDGEVEAGAGAGAESGADDEEEDDGTQDTEERELNVQRLMTLTKSQLVAMAKQKGMTFNKKDENNNKLWFAERIVDFEWSLR